MARRVDAADTPVTVRSALGVTVLALLTFGLHTAWWSFAASRELARFGRARDRRLQPWIRVRPLVAAAATLAVPVLAIACWVARSQAHGATSTSSLEAWRMWTYATSITAAALSAWVAHGTFERVRTAQGLSGIVAEDTLHPAAAWAWIALAVAGGLVGVPAQLWTGWAQRQLNRTWAQYDGVAAAPAAAPPPAHAPAAMPVPVAMPVALPAPHVATAPVLHAPVAWAEAPVHVAAAPAASMALPVVAPPSAAAVSVPGAAPTVHLPPATFGDLPAPPTFGATVPWAERPTMAAR